MRLVDADLMPHIRPYSAAISSVFSDDFCSYSMKKEIK